MPKPFHELRERLLQAGVAPRHVRRYLSELADHLTDLTAEEEQAGCDRADAESAAFVRLGSMDNLARAMTEKRQFQSWCSRAPWACFGLAPLFVLVSAWCFALFILWSGWRIFLPETETPFVPIHGLAIFYFGVGKLTYFTAPLLIGWGIGIIAARQRLKVMWPAFGITVIALIGGTAQIHAGRVSGGAEHVGMRFALEPSLQGSILNCLTLLLLSILPYLLWRVLKARSFGRSATCA
ncbi:hypothetical protein [Alloacidobacterium sp.]|uniref:hypothetical protein n=1 Tax=Alloacidobacterium sp. TaxID=2951999 RepID=UPI002D518D9C|nr:hypothetical protein [Alloacidobacterium sp.]HYK37904.1 hypothetical protein [Alloacidobacterium sp.]